MKQMIMKQKKTNLISVGLIVVIIGILLYLKFAHLVGFCMSESMSPVIQKGDLFFVIKTTNLTSGDIIAFKPEEYDMLVVHRIVNITERALIYTKGDANSYIDPVHPEIIYGKVWLIIPNGIYIYYIALISFFIIILLQKGENQ